MRGPIWVFLVDWADPDRRHVQPFPVIDATVRKPVENRTVVVVGPTRELHGASACRGFQRKYVTLFTDGGG